MAFDPGQDDPQLLRTVVMLLRTVAIAASARAGATEMATGRGEDQRGAGTTRQDRRREEAGPSIQTSAVKIDSECTGLSSGIRRLLDQAMAALAGGGAAAPAARTADLEEVAA